MKKLWVSFGACALASVSFASVNLNLDQEYWFASFGSWTVVYGTIVLTPDWDLDFAEVEPPSDGSNTLDAFVHPDLLGYLLQDTSATYTGALFMVDTNFWTPNGIFDESSLFPNGNERAEFGVHATRMTDNATATDYENYGIYNPAIPEPSSLAALALGAAALLRRRKSV